MYSSGYNFFQTTTENSMSHVARKPTQTSTRKPFLDRSVNGMTPNVKKASEKELDLQKSCAKQQKIELESEEDLQVDDYISYEPKYEDFIDEKPFLTVDNLNRFLKNFAGIRDYPLPPPEVEEHLFIEEFNETFDGIQENSVLLLEEEVHEMPPPIDFDVDDLNCSV